MTCQILSEYKAIWTWRRQGNMELNYSYLPKTVPFIVIMSGNDGVINTLEASTSLVLKPLTYNSNHVLTVLFTLT